MENLTPPPHTEQQEIPQNVTPERTQSPVITADMLKTPEIQAIMGTIYNRGFVGGMIHGTVITQSVMHAEVIAARMHAEVEAF